MSFGAIFLSGWFQIGALVLAFAIFSSRVLRTPTKRGYALGGLIGIFVMFVYVSLGPTGQMDLRGYAQPLSIGQVMVAVALGGVSSLAIGGLVYALRNNHIRNALTVAIVTAMFLIAIFIQIIGSPAARLMISLGVVTFGIFLLLVRVLTKPHRSQQTSESLPDRAPQPMTGERLRENIRQRVNSNDVPSSYRPDYSDI